MQTLRRVYAGVGGFFGCWISKSCLVFATAIVGGAAFFFGTAIDPVRAANADIERVVIAPGRAASTISLRDRLVVGLQARLKSEVAFVELVVAKVRAGKLPQRLVDETFLWARQRVQNGRTPRTYRPIVFFEPAMRLRAKRLKVEI